MKEPKTEIKRGGDQMLVKLSIGFFRGRKTSHMLEHEAAEEHGAQEDRICVRLMLINKEDYRKMVNVTRAARRLMKLNTMPFDGPWRRTTTKIYSEIAPQVDRLHREALDVMMEIGKRWKEVVAEAKKSLPGLVEDGDFPESGDEFVKSFKFSLSVSKISEDVTFNLPQSELDKLRGEFQVEQKERMEHGYKWLADWALGMVKPVLDSVKSGAAPPDHVLRKLKDAVAFVSASAHGDSAKPAYVEKLERMVAQLEGGVAPKKKEVEAAAQDLMEFGGIK